MKPQHPGEVVQLLTRRADEPPPPVSEVVERLEQLLASAKAGRLRGFAAVWVETDGVSEGMVRGDASIASLLAGSVWLQRRIADYAE